MQIYLLVAAFTFVLLVIRTYIVAIKEGANPNDASEMTGYYFLLAVASMLWFITWPLLIIYGVIEFSTFLLNKTVLRKYLKKGKN